MSAKNKTLIFISFILVFFSIAVLAVVKMQQEQEMSAFQNNHFNDIKTSYENIDKKYDTYYEDIVAHYFNDVEIKQAIRNKDKELLYKLVLNKYTMLEKYNNDLIIMKFHLPDSTLFLDMNHPNNNKKEKSGILVQKLYKNKKISSNLESEKEHLVYKSVYPIVYSGEYIGAIEFGVNIEYILKDMKQYSNIAGVMFILPKNKISYKTINDMEIVDKLMKKNIIKVQENIETRKGVKYSVYSFNVKNNEDITLAKLYFLNNITKESNKFETDLQNIALFLLAMVLLGIIVVAFGVSRSLKDLESRFHDLYEYTDMIDNNIMIVDTTEDGHIVGVSRRFCEISGYGQKELLGKSFEMLKDTDVPKKFYDDMHEELKKDRRWNGDLQNKTKDGNTFWLDVVIEEKTKDDKFVCYNHIMHNITSRKKSEELVFIDELTNTYNRRYFNDVFPRMVHGIKRNGGCLNFIVLDVDDFKTYNEIYGAQKGDMALIAIAEVLVKSLRRPDDYCFRLGGGEFGVLYRSATEDEGYLYAQVLKKNIEMIGIKHQANLTYKVLTASLGLSSLLSDKIQSEEQIYKMAYEHLSRAKEDGRNKVIRNLM